MTVAGSSARALDQGQCLEDRVVQVGGDVGALGRPDPLGLLGLEPLPHPDHPRQRDDGGADEDSDRGQRAGEYDVEALPLGRERDDTDRRQHDADDRPGDRQRAAPTGTPRPAPALVGVQLRPGEERTDSDGDDREQEPEVTADLTGRTTPAEPDDEAPRADDEEDLVLGERPATRRRGRPAPPTCPVASSPRRTRRGTPPAGDDRQHHE